jgi:hypothetical protein
MLKLVFSKTTNNTIRVWMYFNKEQLHFIQTSKDYQLFQLLSIWGGYDKSEEDCFSWELPMSLKYFLKQKYEDLDFLQYQFNF